MLVGGRLLITPPKYYFYFQLEEGTYAAHFKTLNLFAYGTYKDYLENKSEYLELTPVQCKKLQHLTIATLATQEKCIPYSVLLKELDIKNVRDLEDLIIEAIYAGEIFYLGHNAIGPHLTTIIRSIDCKSQKRRTVNENRS